MTETERVSIAGAVRILGVSARTVQRLANNRELPSAAKIGRLWTFNEQALRTWLVEQETKQPCQRIERKPLTGATGAATRSGHASWSPGKSQGGGFVSIRNFTVSTFTIGPAILCQRLQV